jgi:general stress protein 26
MTDETSGWPKLWDLIKDIKVGMFTARHGDGHLHSWPMTTLNRRDERDNVLWFFMPKSGEPALDISGDSGVNVSYADPATEAYVSVSGSARFVDDMAKKKALWSPFAQAWFPGGAADGDLALVAVTIEHAEYWDVDGNKAVKLFEMAKAAMTGTRPDIGEHREMRGR